MEIKTVVQNWNMQIKVNSLEIESHRQSKANMPQNSHTSNKQNWILPSIREGNSQNLLPTSKWPFCPLHDFARQASAQNMYVSSEWSSLVNFNPVFVEIFPLCNLTDLSLNYLRYYDIFLAAFLWGDWDLDQWSKICLGHGASKEPVNPYPEWIRRFLCWTMIQTDLESLIRIWITPKERSLWFLFSVIL